MAAEVVDNAEKVQSFFTSDEMRLDLRKQHLYKRKVDAGEMTVQQAEEQLQGHIAYYKNFNDHGRVKHLRRIIHATFRGGESHV